RGSSVLPPPPPPPPPRGGGGEGGGGGRRARSGPPPGWYAGRAQGAWGRGFSPGGGGGVGRSREPTHSTATVVQLLERNGAATHGMPASRILSMAFSSTLRHATPTMASTWPLTMIFRTMGVPSETRTL